MANKKQTEQTNSFDHQQQYSNRSSLQEKLVFDIQIKRESHFYSKWKKRIAHIHYFPYDSLTINVKIKEKKGEEEVIDLKNAKISKRCSIVQGHHCFGLQLKNGKRYLMGRQTQAKTLVMFDNVSRLKKYVKQHRLMDNAVELKNQKTKKLFPIQENNLLFQKSGCYETEQQKEKILKQQKDVLINQKMQYQIDQCNMNQEQRQQMIEDYDEYCTVMQQEPVVDEMEQKSQLHLKLPIPIEFIEYLQSDQDFKLKQHFKEGRILQNGSFVKSNLLLKTHLNEYQLLQSFFHLQLWNSRVKKYELMNRIDEGIYVVYVEFYKMSIFSIPKYCYMMATSIIIDNQPYLVIKSLDQSHFQRTSGCQWVDLAIWTKLRGTDQSSTHKFLSVCLKIEQKSISLGLSLIEQLKSYQSYLLTTNKFPHPILQWRKINPGQ